MCRNPAGNQETRIDRIGNGGTRAKGGNVAAAAATTADAACKDSGDGLARRERIRTSGHLEAINATLSLASSLALRVGRFPFLFFFFFFVRGILTVEGEVRGREKK